MTHSQSPIPSTQSLPQHVAIIMDGNGRWAKAQGLSRSAGHKKGMDSLKRAMDACRKFGVPYLTVYAFSAENWKRPAAEIHDLMQLLQHYLRSEIGSLHEHQVRLRFIGDIAALEAPVQALIEDALEQTSSYRRFNLTIALSYGGRQEITRAVRKLAAQVANGSLPPSAIDEAAVEAALDTADIPSPDLLIRTGGEKRISNFLLWQSAYTEFYFCDTLWPEFSEADFAAALQDFSGRERRFGTAGTL